MSAASFTRMRGAPALTGLATLVLAVLVMEALIRTGILNRYIVPMPSQIAAAFERIIVEEQVFARFLLTLQECVAAAALLIRLERLRPGGPVGKRAR